MMNWEPNFDKYQMSNKNTKTISDLWHNWNSCGGPIMTRTLRCINHQNIFTPKVIDLIYYEKLEILGFF